MAWAWAYPAPRQGANKAKARAELRAKLNIGAIIPARDRECQRGLLRLATHYIEPALDDGIEFRPRHLRAGADRDGVKGCGGKMRQHLRLGGSGQFAALLRPAKNAGEEAVGFDKPRDHHLANGWIEHRF